MVKSLLIVLKKSATDTFNFASKRAIQKTAEATGDLVGDKTANKITSISKKAASEPHSNAASNDMYLNKKDKKIWIII